MRALCMVAHPDDCVIFAYSLMHHLRSLDWTVCYLTYTDRDPRYQELRSFWQERNISTQCLGYTDDWRDLNRGCCSFDTTQADIDIREVCSHYDMILTHSAAGDYGHLHHRFVHDSVTSHHNSVITFAPPGKGTHYYELPHGTYSLDELPLHGSVVADFHQSRHANSYLVSPRAQALLGGLL